MWNLYFISLATMFLVCATLLAGYVLAKNVSKVNASSCSLYRCHGASKTSCPVPIGTHCSIYGNYDTLWAVILPLMAI